MAYYIICKNDGHIKTINLWPTIRKFKGNKFGPGNKIRYLP